ncbi:MAG: hypothetical protein HGA26_08990, partial [Chlorobiaceae bacterium]|nr:hypothetical protein [Chlorobiaceae bacterium]
MILSIDSELPAVRVPLYVSIHNDKFSEHRLELVTVKRIPVMTERGQLAG